MTFYNSKYRHIAAMALMATSSLAWAQLSGHSSDSSYAMHSQDRAIIQAEKFMDEVARLHGRSDVPDKPRETDSAVLGDINKSAQKDLNLTSHMLQGIKSIRLDESSRYKPAKEPLAVSKVKSYEEGALSEDSKEKAEDDAITGDNFAFPKLDTYSDDRPYVIDTDPRSRTIINDRLMNRHGLTHRDVAIFSRIHVQVEIEGEEVRLSREEAMKVSGFVDRTPNRAPLYLMVFNKDASQSLDGDVVDSIQRDVLQVIDQRGKSFDMTVDRAGRWPAWFGGGSNHGYRVELAAPAM